jgi:hypothetical protein
MGKNSITIDGDNLILTEAVMEKLRGAAVEMIDQNTPLIMLDLRKTAADSDDQKGELPVTLTFKLTSYGKKILIDAAIEWKRVKKSGDSLDLITIDPDQKELPFGN